MLDDLGLMAAVEWYSKEVFEDSKITLEFLNNNNIVEPSREVATAVYRVCQEAITNVLRHSGARRTRVSARMVAGKLTLEVYDDGICIDEEKLSSASSFGILGMKERMASVDGSLVIESSSGNGTRVVMEAPVK